MLLSSARYQLPVVRCIRFDDNPRAAREFADHVLHIVGRQTEKSSDRRVSEMRTVNFAAGGVATPADAALMMQLGMDGVFVGSGIFKSGDPAKRARAIVQAVTHYNDPKIIAEVSCGLGEAMVGIDCKEMHFTSYAARSE